MENKNSASIPSGKSTGQPVGKPQTGWNGRNGQTVPPASYRPPSNPPKQPASK